MASKTGTGSKKQSTKVAATKASPKRTTTRSKPEAPETHDDAPPPSSGPKTYPKAQPEDVPPPSTPAPASAPAPDSSAAGTPDASEGAAAADTPPAAPSANKKGQQHGRSRKTAEKRLANAIDRVEKFPWEAWGITDITLGLSLFRKGLLQLREIPKGARVGSPEKVGEGSIVRVKAKFRTEYEDIIGAEHLAGIKVESIRKNQALCITAANEKVFLPLRKIEVDVAPATKADS